MQQGSTNARHRKRHWTTERRNPLISDGLRKITRGDGEQQQQQQQQEQQHRSHRAFSSSWRTRLFRMIQLRLLQWTSPRRRVLTFIGLFLVVFIWIIALLQQPLHDFFWGDGYHVEGGVLGRLMDHIVAVLYYERYSSSHRNIIKHNDDGVVVVEYPKVKLRSNRKEIPGYSRYLEEILTRHSNNNKKLAAADWYPKNIITTTTSHGASFDDSMHDVIQEWNVDIQEQEINENNISTSSSNASNVPLRSVADRLRENGCQPGWICHRCLAVPWWGSFDQCSYVCPRCFSSLLCNDDMSSSSFKSEQRDGGGGGEHTIISIQAQVKGGSLVCDSSPRKRLLIPRIVHVVGGPLSLSPLDLLQFPELVRIQNGWRAAGYSYRYYTAKSARALVKRHYPSRFLHVYDALQSSELDQQHFFRLLVLFQQGGIVANDIMLEVNPDALFWTAPTSKDAEPPQQQQQVSFVASIDADMDECLWDGFIAARPGHALVARAIELFYNRLVTQRLDQLEWMKSNACHVDTVMAEGEATAAAKTIPFWKVRNQNHDLLYYGNAKRRGLTFCILGVAVHKAHGSSVSWIDTPFQPGAYTMESQHCTTKTRLATLGGDEIICKDEGMLLLMMSRDDTGATRLTDVDRNLLIASTDVMGVTMESLYARVNKVFRKKQDGGVTNNLRDAIASNKILDSGIPIQIHIRSEEVP